MSCLFLAGVTNWLGIKLIFNRIPGVFFRYDKTIYVAEFAEMKESGRLSFFLFFFFSSICSTAHGCHDPLRKNHYFREPKISKPVKNVTCSASTLTFHDCPMGTVNESEASGQFCSFLHVVMPQAEAL